MKQKQKEQNKVKDKTFGRIVGKIVPETLHFESQYGMSFDFKSKDSIHRFSMNDRRVVTKMCQLYGTSYKNISRDRRLHGKSGIGLISSIEDEIKKVMKRTDRTVVLLTDENVKPISIVSEQHQQLSLSKAYKIVQSVAKKKGAKLVTSRDTGRSYLVEYEVGKDKDMSIRVSGYLGRNDAMGQAGITFQGGGNIFVCSNAIVPHIDSDVQFKGKELMNVKIVHTKNVEGRLEEQLIKSFDAAKNSSNVLSEAFKKCKKIPMSRVLQEHCIELIKLKHNVPEKWEKTLQTRLLKESETLYGLSQCLTYVGTHMAQEDSTIAGTLQRMGGQVVLLGKDFVRLIRKSIEKRGLEVPKLVSN